MHTVFLGSPPFATGVLDALLGSGARPALVITTPDRSRGRGRKEHASPLAELAQGAGLAVLRAESVEEPAVREVLASAPPDAILVASWGEILREAFLALPRLCVLNVHPSLLPRHRGATPVQAAILAGDPVTGVSIQRVVRELDAGDVLATRSVEIGAEETAGELSARLARLGGEAAAEALAALETGTARFRPQDPRAATLCRKLAKEAGRIDWTRPAEELARHVRAMNPWPGAFTTLPDRASLGVHRARALEPGARSAAAAPGALVVAGELVAVACGAGALELVLVQAAGRRALPGAEFLRGARLAAGVRLGTAGA